MRTELPSEPYHEATKLHALAVETRNFEIGKLIERNNFYMLFQGVLLAGVLQADGFGWKVFIVSLAAAAISLLQTMNAAGAKFWQSAWEVVTCRTEQRVKDRFAILYRSDCFIHTFSRTEEQNYADVAGDLPYRGFLERTMRETILRKYSVSRAPIYVGVCCFLAWLALALAAWFAVQ